MLSHFCDAFNVVQLLHLEQYQLCFHFQTNLYIILIDSQQKHPEMHQKHCFKFVCMVELYLAIIDLKSIVLTDIYLPVYLPVHLPV